MHIHILGICGTFMGSLALLAKSLGHRVSGCDASVYPPMSTQLESAGIVIEEGYASTWLERDRPDLVVVGNAMSRGNPSIEALLDSDISYQSGPEWLAQAVLRDRWVLAVAGTHGKTTTASMLAWILDYAGLQPGFLIGGVTENFGVSARLGAGRFFVIEADEYDTAFFDKRSKFVHYRPRTLVLNNLEFDHADIFPDLAAIQTQFHHLLRTVPARGRVIVPAECAALQQVIDRGCWSQLDYLPSPPGAISGSAEVLASARKPDWSIESDLHRQSAFSIARGSSVAHIDWPLSGLHNQSNALAAVAAAFHVGVEPALAGEALSQFGGVRRRMELRATVGGVSVYDDFAHHPTAIESTLHGARNALQASASAGKLLAVIEPRSNTMRSGVHGEALPASAEAADEVWWYLAEGTDTALADAMQGRAHNHVENSIEAIVAGVSARASAGDCIVIMSNGGFAGIHAQVIERLQSLVSKV